MIGNAERVAVGQERYEKRSEHVKVKKPSLQTLVTA